MLSYFQLNDTPMISKNIFPGEQFQWDQRAFEAMTSEKESNPFWFETH